MKWLVDPYSAPYMQRALLELVTLSLLGAVGGTLATLRRLPFLADALSHTIFPGVAIALALGVSLLLGAVIAAVVASALLAVSLRQHRLDPDALMALLVASFFSVGVLVVSRRHSFNADLTALLFGRLLTVDRTVVIETMIVAAVVLATAMVFARPLVLAAFDPMGARAMGHHVTTLDVLTVGIVAAVVVASIRAVGSALVVSVLVTPAATARVLTDRLVRLAPVAFVVGAVSSWIGLSLSYTASVRYDVNLAPSATVTMTMTVVFLAALVVTMWRRRRQRRTVPDIGNAGVGAAVAVGVRP
jgi:manganese/iron transport system permease protein